nr:uncharacterized protein CFP56_20613 [Quercus suber]
MIRHSIRYPPPSMLSTPDARASKTLEQPQAQISPGLLVPYTEPKPEKETPDMQGTMASTLPMAAIFTRNKMIGWTAVIFAIQSWLSETPAQAASSGTPGIFAVGMALLSVLVAYMPLFLPPQVGVPGQGTGTGAPAPATA